MSKFALCIFIIVLSGCQTRTFFIDDFEKSIVLEAQELDLSKIAVTNFRARVSQHNIALTGKTIGVSGHEELSGIYIQKIVNGRRDTLGVTDAHGDFRVALIIPRNDSILLSFSHPVLLEGKYNLSRMINAR